jgi:hypothetical protein
MPDLPAKHRIFISHSSKYGDIARRLTQALRTLDRRQRLELIISEDMTGAVDWRKWIDENTRASDVFVLLYPHTSMDLNWCNYELGRFYGSGQHIVCIKNTDIRQPPPAFQPYQAYDADQDGLMKFLKDLFVTGALTKDEPVRPEIGQLDSDAYAQADGVTASLARAFAEARVREQLYERRLVITVRQDVGKLDAERTLVQGNAEGLSLLGLDEVGPVRWSTLRQALGPGVEWPQEVEAALDRLANGVLPPSLSPARANYGMYIPVITRSESVDGVLRQLVLIFVSVQESWLRPVLHWPLPPNMPQELQSLIVLMRSLFQARWEIVEPRYQEVRFRAPAPERCAAIVQELLAHFERLQKNMGQTEFAGVDAFYRLFERSCHADIDTLTTEWVELMQALHTAAGADADTAALAPLLTKLRANNGRWLALAARQFSKSMEDVVDVSLGD